MTTDILSTWPAPQALTLAMDRAGRAVPPAWPLASSVAVNPFLGQTDEPLAKVGARLARVAGAAVTMPRNWYVQKIATGVISDADLSDALASVSAGPRPADATALKAAAGAEAPPPKALRSLGRRLFRRRAGAVGGT
jgi:hypothetical protein